MLLAYARDFTAGALCAEITEVARNGVELMRLIHHSMNKTAPPPSFRVSKEEGQEEYLAPGGHSMVALFTVLPTALRERHETAGTVDASTWTFIRAVRELPEGMALNVKVDKRTKQGGNTTPETVLTLGVAPLVLQLIAGAPTLAIVLQNARAVLGYQVRLPSICINCVNHIDEPCMMKPRPVQDWHVRAKILCTRLVILQGLKEVARFCTACQQVSALAVEYCKELATARGKVCNSQGAWYPSKGTHADAVYIGGYE